MPLYYKQGEPLQTKTDCSRVQLGEPLKLLGLLTGTWAIQRQLRHWEVSPTV